jgi:hypothetical protein
MPSQPEGLTSTFSRLTAASLWLSLCAPAVVFGFNCHANVVSVFYELEHYPDRIISRLPARWEGSCAGALSASNYARAWRGAVGVLLALESCVHAVLTACNLANICFHVPIKQRVDAALYHLERIMSARLLKVCVDLWHAYCCLLQPQ